MPRVKQEKKAPSKGKSMEAKPTEKKEALSEPPGQKRMISVRHLRKVYQIGDERVIALDDINLDIYQGQIVCIIGTSGSGKSTLLNQLAGLEKPTKGAVYIAGTNISQLNEDRLAIFRQRFLGFVFQSYNLLPTMSALENVALPMIFKGVSKSQRNKAAMTMLGAVGLKKRARHRPTQMSGGQQQRVGIARAFVTRPKVIFADEPTGNLDTKTTIAVMQMMARFSRKYNETLIIVTHDPEISDYADRVITLIDGVITSDETRPPKFETFGEPDEEYGGSAPEKAALSPVEEQPVEEPLKENLQAVSPATKTPPVHETPSEKEEGRSPDLPSGEFEGEETQ